MGPFWTIGIKRGRRAATTTKKRGHEGCGNNECPNTHGTVGLTSSPPKVEHAPHALLPKRLNQDKDPYGVMNIHQWLGGSKAGNTMVLGGRVRKEVPTERTYCTSVAANRLGAVGRCRLIGVER
jgi:hypothetical protein